MSAQYLDGKKCAEALLIKIRNAILDRKSQGFSAPGIAVILVGDDPASKIYVAGKQRACESVGMHSELHSLPADTPTETLTHLITKLNQDPKIHGILLQLPLPPQINTEFLLELIDPKKDVDGFHPYNLGRLAQQRPLLRPCTPWGIMQLLGYYKISVRGLNAVILGTSNIVGRPMALELLLAQATVTICNSKTKNLAEHIQKADLLVSAMGHRNVIQSDWIKPGSIVVDVGMNRLDTGKVVGDIDFASAEKRAGWITPVPGGVGPMTIAVLLENTLRAALLT